MIDQPDFDSYSIQARICLGVAIFGAALLVCCGDDERLPRVPQAAA
ncbi:hypothetical protein Q2941_12495 [Bradyrhizobium sp. UFLA05-153]